MKLKCEILLFSYSYLPSCTGAQAFRKNQFGFANVPNQFWIGLAKQNFLQYYFKYERFNPDKIVSEKFNQERLGCMICLFGMKH